MARPIKDSSREDMMAQIKATATAQMAIHGTAGLSLRGIARELNITAPAIYNYFSTLDDLITALITDAFKSIAQAMTAAINANQQGTAASRIFAAGMAYRQWAIAYPIQFQLIYGNPIPNYAAPADITAPLARLPFEGLMVEFKQAYDSGEMTLPDAYTRVPPSVGEHIRGYLRHVNFDTTEPVVYAIMAAWVHLHGIVMLELFQHITPILGNTEAFYKHELIGFLNTLNLKLPSA